MGSQFQALQTLLAQQAVREVTACLKESSQDLLALASLASAEHTDPTRMQAGFQAYYQTSKHPRPLSISVVDAKGALIYSSHPSSATVNYSGRDFFEWTKRKDRQGKVFVGAMARTEKESSEHPEMARESIQRVNSRCYQCHASFDYAEKMLATRKPGTTEYQLKGQPKKLASYVPMRFANASWILASSTKARRSN